MKIKLKQFRIGLNLTQAEMAKKCGVGLSAYGEIERGETDGSLKFWHNLMTNYELSPIDLCSIMFEGK